MPCCANNARLHNSFSRRERTWHLLCSMGRRGFYLEGTFMKTLGKMSFLIILLVLVALAGNLQAAPDDHKADLAITIDDSQDPVTAGNQLVYQITVTNLGDPDP